MWEVWTGQEPFDGWPTFVLLHKLASPQGLTPPLPGDPDWAELQAPAEPAQGWCQLIRDCWLPAAQRPTARQLIRRLEGLMQQLREVKRSTSRRGLGAEPADPEAKP
jgi:hypothetical protein